MKVLVLTTSFPLHGASQSGIFIQKMVEHLPSGIDVTVLCPDDNSTHDALSQRGYTVHRYAYAPKSWQVLAHGSGGIMTALAQNKWNILLLPIFLASCAVHTLYVARTQDLIHANWSINGVLASIIALFLRKPVLITLRGSDVNLASTSCLMRHLVGTCLRLGQGLVTVSPSLRQVLLDQYPQYRHKIQVIANGIDEEFFHIGEQRTATNREVIRFLYAGNLLTSKGIQVLLEAATKVSASPAWCLDLVGDGPDRKHWENFCQEQGLQEKVFFHGAVAPKHMPFFLQQADVFVFASFAEGRPNAVLEAMAAGLPVLATAIPALQELLTPDHEGLLFPPGDAQQLAQYMDHLLLFPQERHRMGRAAHRTLAALGLSWQATGEQYAALYSKLISKE